jgi:hypothetical protein
MVQKNGATKFDIRPVTCDGYHATREEATVLHVPTKLFDNLMLRDSYCLSRGAESDNI